MDNLFTQNCTLAKVLLKWQIVQMVQWIKGQVAQMAQMVGSSNGSIDGGIYG
jgi:hypothetical protein